MVSHTMLTIPRQMQEWILDVVFGIIGHFGFGQQEWDSYQMVNVLD
jgi:hypothetical protein